MTDDLKSLWQFTKSKNNIILLDLSGLSNLEEINISRLKRVLSITLAAGIFVVAQTSGAMNFYRGSAGTLLQDLDEHYPIALKSFTDSEANVFVSCYAKQFSNLLAEINALSNNNPLLLTCCIRPQTSGMPRSKC